MNGAPDSCRIDVWLWRARFFKTRALAARIVEGRGVRCLRGPVRLALDKPSRLVRVGDVITLPQGPKLISVRIEGFGERRGPATEARELYTRLDGGQEG